MGPDDQKGPSKRAIVVEDAANWRELFRLKLEGMSFNVETAQSYGEVVFLLRHKSFDLAVIDLQLACVVQPENLHGIFLLEWLIAKKTPVVIVTGFAVPPLVDAIYHDYYQVFQILDKTGLDWEAFAKYVQQAGSYTLPAYQDVPSGRETRRSKFEQLIKEVLEARADTPEELAYIQELASEHRTCLQIAEELVQERPMAVMYRQIRETLLDCGPLASDDQLSAVFAHPLLKPWRSSVPQATNPAARADAMIAFLVEKHLADTKENALVILLHELSERLDPADECHHRLVGLARDLERALGGRSPAGQAGLSAGNATVQLSKADTEIIAEIEALVREDQLAKALMKLSKVVVYRRDAALLNQRLNRTRAQERRGLVTHEVANAERTRIAEAILDLISS